MGKSTISMTTFNSYVRLPEGINSASKPLLRCHIAKYPHWITTDNSDYMFHCTPHSNQHTGTVEHVMNLCVSRREWMGMGVAGTINKDMKWVIPSFPTAPVRKTISIILNHPLKKSPNRHELITPKPAPKTSKNHHIVTSLHLRFEDLIDPLLHLLRRLLQTLR